MIYCYLYLITLLPSLSFSLPYLVLILQKTTLSASTERERAAVMSPTECHLFSVLRTCLYSCLPFLCMLLLFFHFVLFLLLLLPLSCLHSPRFCLKFYVAPFTDVDLCFHPLTSITFIYFLQLTYVSFSIAIYFCSRTLHIILRSRLRHSRVCYGICSGPSTFLDYFIFVVTKRIKFLKKKEI